MKPCGEAKVVPIPVTATPMNRPAAWASLSQTNRLLAGSKNAPALSQSQSAVPIRIGFRMPFLQTTRPEMGSVSRAAPTSRLPVLARSILPATMKGRASVTIGTSCTSSSQIGFCRGGTGPA